MRSSAGPAVFRRALARGALFAALAAMLALPLAGCATRSSEGAYAPDSTLVYASLRPSDVDARITFALKGSKKAEEARKAEIAAKKRAAEEKKAAEREKTAKKKPSKKPRASKKKATAAADTTRSAPKKTPRLVEDRIFEIEEGARVQASISLSNRLARGQRPLLFHMVWLKPDGKRTFKKQFEFDPTAADSTITGSMTISPEKRVPGTYTMRVFLFRELIAEKSFELTGTGADVEEREEGQM